jgi:hypothetical protein
MFHVLRSNDFPVTKALSVGEIGEHTGYLVD